MSVPEARLDLPALVPALVPTASLFPLASSHEATPYKSEGWCKRTNG